MDFYKVDEHIKPQQPVVEQKPKISNYRESDSSTSSSDSENSDRTSESEDAEENENAAQEEGKADQFEVITHADAIDSDNEKDYGIVGEDDDNVNRSSKSTLNIKLTTRQLKDIQSFERYEKIVAEESETVEFKAYRWPLPENLQEILKKTICGFLNNKGGRIYFGIDDNDGKVVGVKLNRKEKDEMKLFLNDEILRTFNPKCRVGFVSTMFLPIFDRTNLIPDVFVVKTIIRQGDVKTIYTIDMKGQLVFFRKDGQSIPLSVSECLKLVENPVQRTPETEFNDKPGDETIIPMNAREIILAPRSFPDSKKNYFGKGDPKEYANSSTKPQITNSTNSIQNPVGLHTVQVKCVATIVEKVVEAINTRWLVGLTLSKSRESKNPTFAKPVGYFNFDIKNDAWTFSNRINAEKQEGVNAVYLPPQKPIPGPQPSAPIQPQSELASYKVGFQAIGFTPTAEQVSFWCTPIHFSSLRKPDLKPPTSASALYFQTEQDAQTAVNKIKSILPTFKPVFLGVDKKSKKADSKTYGVSLQCSLIKPTLEMLTLWCGEFKPCDDPKPKLPTKQETLAYIYFPTEAGAKGALNRISKMLPQLMPTYIESTTLKKTKETTKSTTGLVDTYAIEVKWVGKQITKKTYKEWFTGIQLEKKVRPTITNDKSSAVFYFKTEKDGLLAEAKLKQVIPAPSIKYLGLKKMAVKELSYNGYGVEIATHPTTVTKKMYQTLFAEISMTSKPRKHYPTVGHMTFYFATQKEADTAVLLLKQNLPQNAVKLSGYTGPKEISPSPMKPISSPSKPMKIVEEQKTVPPTVEVKPKFYQAVELNNDGQIISPEDYNKWFSGLVIAYPPSQNTICSRFFFSSEEDARLALQKVSHIKPLLFPRYLGLVEVLPSSQNLAVPNNEEMFYEVSLKCESPIPTIEQWRTIFSGLNLGNVKYPRGPSGIVYLNFTNEDDAKQAFAILQADRPQTGPRFLGRGKPKREYSPRPFEVASQEAGGEADGVFTVSVKCTSVVPTYQEFNQLFNGLKYSSKKASAFPTSTKLGFFNFATEEHAKIAFQRLNANYPEFGARFKTEKKI
jgi:hypothetical protein